MSIHIEELAIDSYRGLRGMRLKNLNDINILTGDNNSGKTSVLELISTLEGPDTFSAWRSCTRSSTRSTFRRMYFEEFYYLFPIDREEKRVAFDVTLWDGTVRRISLVADVYETLLSEEEMNFINGLRVRGGEEQNQDQPAECMELRALVDGEMTELLELYDFQYRVRQRDLATKSGKHRFLKTVYVEPFSHASESIRMREVLSKREQYEGLLEALREFDPSIVAVTAVPAEHGLVPDYRILSSERREALPLSAYGDGMKKAVVLCASAVAAREGVLLLDEFETAIHTSAMSATFELLLRTALRMNVQVFMTSHSKEAIEKVLSLGEEIQEHINLYTLYKHGEKSLVRRMTCSEAIEANEHLGIDLR